MPYKKLKRRLFAVIDSRVHASLNPILERLSRIECQAGPFCSDVVPGISTENKLFGSSLCRAEDMLCETYQLLCSKLGLPIVYHRKHWEWVFICHKLMQYKRLQPHMKGLGFGVGIEPLPSYLASLGCQLMLTDAPPEISRDWIGSNQHANDLRKLHRNELIDETTFTERCQFSYLDMNNYASIPSGYDFHWSSCVIEHLGGLDAGIRFIEESVSKLAVGGVAVHTTEFNMTSSTETLDHPATCIYRKSDLMGMKNHLERLGYFVEPLVFDPGMLPPNYYVDMPPYKHDVHLRLMLDRFVSTSIGLVIQRRT
jgi:hypothetical protein